VLGALGALGISAGNYFYRIAVENPIGINSYMYSITEYIQSKIGQI